MRSGSEKVTFPGAAGDELAARLDMPAGAPRGYALFAHCFTCSKDIFAASRIAGALAGHGIAVLRFDFTGLGASEGEFANTNFSSNVGDLIAAAGWLRGNREAPKLLIGHSLGGAAVLAAASEIPEAVAVATIGAPFDPGHVAGHFADDVARIRAEGEAEVTLGGRSFRVRRQFLDDIAGRALGPKIGNLHKALMIFHAPRDEIVGIDNAADIFQAAKHPKSFVSLDDADHLLTRKADAAYVADVLAAWAGRWLGAAPASEATAGEEGAVVVAENGNGRFGQDITVGAHLLHADEPASYGGRDSGPNPYALLSAALGACTTMTMRMYAERKEWPLDKATVTVRHDKIHAEDCADCETREGKVDRFTREIVLDGALDEAQREKLLEIAEKCPVHRTLHSEVQVLTTLAGTPRDG
ncbi:MAG: alpha/beta fold hydrolase [Alphaproteobacteria bacterium]|nr:alpha/beta fold hydrolase [Alphaproteobacteria bacterium]